MRKEEKERLIRKAAMLHKTPFDEIREVLAVMVVDNKSYGTMEAFIRSEGYDYSAGQIKYYLKKNPLTEKEINDAQCALYNIVGK